MFKRRLLVAALLGAASPPALNAVAAELALKRGDAVVGRSWLFRV
jgi:hypothetical protein